MNIPHRHNVEAGIAWHPAGIVPVELAAATGPEDPRWAMEVVNGPRTRPHAVLVCTCADIRLIPLDKLLVYDPRQDAAEPVGS